MEHLKHTTDTQGTHVKSGFAKIVDKINLKTTAVYCTAIAGLGASNAAFALDATEIVKEIDELEEPLTKIGVAVIGLVLIGYGFAKAKGMIK